MRERSLSSDGSQFFTDGLRVLKQGHASDPRVSAPHPDYKAGLSVDRLSSQHLRNLQFTWTPWPAGLVIGLGKDASHLLQQLEGKAPGLAPYWVANSLFESVPLPTCCPPTKWWQLWNSVAQPLQSFLSALEKTSEAEGLAQRVATILERKIFESAVDAPLPLQIGRTYGVLIEVTQPVVDIVPPMEIERLYGFVTVAGQLLGSIELPVCDGRVSQLVLKDCIAAQFCWQILEHFYEKVHYSQQFVQTDTGVVEKSLHDQIGWTTFLQDLWDRPNWTQADFYDALRLDPSTKILQLETNELIIEASQPLPDVEVSSADLKVVLTVGGIAFGQFVVQTDTGKVSAQALRSALTLAGGIELCRVSVREAYIGQSITQAATIRQRLQIVAQQRSAIANTAQATCSTLVSEAFEGMPHRLVLGQRHQLFGSSSSRWASLPAETAKDMEAMAAVVGEAIAYSPDSHQPIQQVVYAPDALSFAQLEQSHPADLNNDENAAIQTSFNNRDYFETLFAAQPNPWEYTTPYEQTKYEQTLSLLPKKDLRALELACAEGHFTAQLAPHVKSLVATDISQIAVERTAQRCTQSHVQCQQLDMVADVLPGKFELIVCSEVLYYVGGWEALQSTAQKIADALAPGGYFLTAHANLVVDEPDCPGYNWDHPFGAKGIGDTFQQIENLRLVKELWTPLYRVQLFQKSARSWIFWRRHSPTLVKLPQPTPPPEAVATHVLWEGGEPYKMDAQPVTTERLPILMYHRVAPEGAEAMQQWRTSPAAFAEQLGYLRDAGYYSVSLKTWGEAIAHKQPLPGRAIVLTFDDGYLDFLTYAYPILQTYGFSATVFLVADQVGKSNQWDTVYGERVPLMDWSQIRQLQAQGIEFGSHTVTHRPLTALSAAEVVREGGRSRTLITQELGIPVQTIAYPYGDVDPVVQHLIGACGYTLGVSCRSGRSCFRDSPLLLPRIEITGSDGLDAFIRKLSEA